MVDVSVREHDPLHTARRRAASRRPAASSGSKSPRQSPWPDARPPRSPTKENQLPAKSAISRPEHVQRQSAEIQCTAVEFLQRQRPGRPSRRAAAARSAGRSRTTAPGRASQGSGPARSADVSSAIALCDCRNTHARSGVPDTAVGSRQPAVHTDVDNHPRGPEALGVQHSHPVACVVEPAELGHQPLGVQRPSLAVARHPAAQPAPPVQPVRRDDRPADLKVMPGTPSWNTVVVSCQVRKVSTPGGTDHHIRPGRVRSSDGPV